MKYTREDIQKVNELNIIDVASKLGMEIKTHHKTSMALCLWHAENTPSMQVGGKYNTCRCYACGEKHGVIDMIMKHESCKFTEAMEWAMREFSIVTTSESGGQTPLIHLTRPRAKSESGGQTPLIQYISMEMVDARVSIDNALSKCLLRRFPREVVAQVTQMYRLGHDEGLLHYEHTWFPSIDQYGRVHNIKVQGYCTNPDVPLFGHSMKGQTLWLGTVLQKRGLLDKDKEFDNECLFGEHLLAGGGPVVLVESPKNAVVGACWRPDLTWVAVGNKGMLKRSVLEPLRGRKVLVIPDRDAIDEWKKTLSTMRDLATFIFSDFCQSTQQADNKKLDIADLILQPPNPRG